MCECNQMADASYTRLPCGRALGRTVINQTYGARYRAGQGQAIMLAATRNDGIITLRLCPPPH